MNNWGGLTVKEPRLYNIWIGMIQRCENPEREKFSDYGGRGISVCAEWHDFCKFVSWAKQNGYEDGLTIDRKNVDGNYDPVNCRWATIDEQANNKRSNVVLSCRGVSGTVKQWSDLLRISPYTIHEWVNKHNVEYAESRIIETVRNGGMVKQTVVKKCEKCGEEYETLATVANSKYCASCRKEKARERSRNSWRKKHSCGARVEEEA